jgi:hypothetical protein
MVANTPIWAAPQQQGTGIGDQRAKVGQRSYPQKDDRREQFQVNPLADEKIKSGCGVEHTVHGPAAVVQGPGGKVGHQGTKGDRQQQQRFILFLDGQIEQQTADGPHDQHRSGNILEAGIMDKHLHHFIQDVCHYRLPLNLQQTMTFIHGIPFLDQHGPHGTTYRCNNRGLHLHGIQHNHGLINVVTTSPGLTRHLKTSPAMGQVTSVQPSAAGTVEGFGVATVATGVGCRCGAGASDG